MKFLVRPNILMIHWVGKDFAKLVPYQFTKWCFFRFHWLYFLILQKWVLFYSYKKEKDVYKISSKFALFFYKFKFAQNWFFQPYDHWTPSKYQYRSEEQLYNALKLDSCQDESSFPIIDKLKLHLIHKSGLSFLLKKEFIFEFLQSLCRSV